MKRRHRTGFSYIGAGNNTFVFNRKPKKVFSTIKNQLNTKSNTKFKLTFNDKRLTETDRKAIKNKIRSANRKKNSTALLFSILLLIPLFLVIKAIFEGLLFH